MALTDAERKAVERMRRRKTGLQRYELWLFPENWPLVKAFALGIKKKTLDKDRSR